jgi:hypothetical protein
MPKGTLTHAYLNSKHKIKISKYRFMVDNILYILVSQMNIAQSLKSLGSTNLFDKIQLTDRLNKERSRDHILWHSKPT